MYYFSYGSFMDSETLRRHAPSMKFVTRALLPNYEVQFNFLSKTYSGGVTSVEPAPNKVVRGVVYDVSLEDLQRLDSVEGVPKGIYYRQKIIVVDELKKLMTVEIYRTTEPSGPFKTTRRYLGLMIKGAKEHCLDPGYIGELEEKYNSLDA